MSLPVEAVRGERVRILIVDDEPDTLRTYRDILESAGYEVGTAESAERALEVVGEQPPDLILLDIMLPGRSGVEVAQELSTRIDTQRILIVVVTALDPYPLESELQSVKNVRRFIYKPCRPRTLLEGVADALGRNGGPNSPAREDP